MHDRISVNGICFIDSSFRARPSFREQAGYWRELGLRRVSLTSDLIAEEGVAAAQEALESGGCKVETISHQFLRDGQHYSDATSWVKSRDRLHRLIADAETIGARSIYMLTGGHGTLTWEDAAERFSEAVAPCVPEAKAAGVALAIETAGAFRAHFHLAHTLQDTITLTEKANIGICLDVFSIWTESALQQKIKRAIQRIAVVQLSDYVFGDACLPGRAVPGDGNIPLKRIIEWIVNAGYRGNFDLEIVGARIDQEGHIPAIRRSVKHITEILQSLGA
jgi:sugar phosphate isomerase/epimerase